MKSVWMIAYSHDEPRGLSGLRKFVRCKALVAVAQQ